MKSSPGFYLVWIILLVSGCEFIDPVEERIEYGVRTDLVLSMKQELNPSRSGLNFIFEGVKPYACEGAGFDYKVSSEPENIDIQILQEDIPDPCYGGNSFATEIISLPGDLGAYALSISIGDIIENKGTLFIDQKGYRLIMDTQDGMSIPYIAMHRIPQGIIWGYVFHDHLQQQALSQLQSQLSSFTSASNLDEGNYGHFYASTPQNISFNLPTDRNSAEPFVLQYHGDSFSLGSLINNTRQQLPDGTELVVYSWNGLVY